MIYVLSATQVEVKYLIKNTPFQKLKINRIRIFAADNWVLIITGIGRNRVEKALNIVMDQYGIGNDDIVINCGLAGSFHNRVGEIFQIDQIGSGSTTELITNRKIFFNHSNLYSTEKFTLFNNEIDANLIDMEAATVYKKMKSIVNEVYIFKCISDSCYRKTRNMFENFLNCYKKLSFLFKLDGPIYKLNEELEKVIAELAG